MRKPTKKPAKPVKKKRRVVRRRIARKIVLPQLEAVIHPRILSESPRPSPSADHRLPSSYGEDRLVLLVRDPWWLFAYWEVTKARQEEVAREAERAGCWGWKTVLRVYDVTQCSVSKPRSFFDITLNFYVDNWYIDVGLPDREWIAQLGLLAENGRLFVLVESNRVRTPSFGISDALDEEWLLPEDVYYRLIGMSGLNAQQGSMDIRKILEKYLKRLVSSGSLPQVSQTA